MKGYLARVYAQVKKRNRAEPLFLQAVHEVLSSLEPVLIEHPEIEDSAILERLTEPERQIIFRVAWQDDRKRIRVNRGFRLGFSSALGPYKGGLRFHPTVDLGTVKFLAFEQVFKNSLTGLSIGGGKGGSDFDPKGRSDNEVMRFCQAFMSELFRYVGFQTDVPAGDIGVGAREIGYLFGQYKKLTNRFEPGVLTGKEPGLGGLLGRKEATGFGTVYFAEEMLRAHSDGLEGKTCVVSGSGNVALYCIRKLQDLGAKVVACSDSGGIAYESGGIGFDVLKAVKEVERGRVSDYVDRRPQAELKSEGRIWDIPCDLAFPCATQNELDGNDAETLVKNGCKLVAEGANMPSTPDAVTIFQKAGVLYGPAKAANAGGVAVSALEMRQNASQEQWTFRDVDDQLRQIMESIHNSCAGVANRFNRHNDYAFGANVAGFLRVAQAVQAYGVV
ncbi:MAG: NADP-specific glutamate dehydrogenase [Verrucomicrobia bacterium]|nr:MAG: NADP-specific glutamate dehydrogenase [Verrucomicrobiota bacterium]